jgi:hypothetical protein
VSCTERAASRVLAGALALALAACSSVPTKDAGHRGNGSRTSPSMQGPLPAGPQGSLAGPRSRNWDQFRQLAAQQLVAASPGRTYDSVPPDVLLAVPVLLVQLNGDGSVRRVEVLRYPRQARDTVDIAVAAVRRAAPFGDVSHLPRPWQFTESFLFNDDRKFKPRTLDR